MKFKNTDENGYPIWTPHMTVEEKRAYRKLKHRWHAARSRRLRGRDVPEFGQRGERQDYENEEHHYVETNPHHFPRND